MTTLIDAVLTLAPYAVAGVGALWAHRSAIATGARTGQQVAAAALAHAEPLRLRRGARIVVLRGPAESGESPVTAYLSGADGWALVVTHPVGPSGELTAAAIADIAAADGVVLDRADQAQFTALREPLARVEVIAGLTPPRVFYADVAAYGSRFTGASTADQAAFWLLQKLMRREQLKLSRLLIPVPLTTDGAPTLPAPVVPGTLAAATPPTIDPAAYERIVLPSWHAAPTFAPVAGRVTVL